jgi:hypothetical protein
MENLPLQNINSKIYEIRDIKVMLDSDIAKLYDVETSYLNRQVKRHFDKFDESDFMFQLTKEEFENLKCQIGTSSWGGQRKLPFVFTEQGVYMLATVINSSIATQVTKQIMRTFTKMREFALNYKDIATRIQEIEKTIKIDQQHQNYNSNRIDEAFELLHQILQDTQKTNNNLIGFRPKIPNE